MRLSQREQRRDANDRAVVKQLHIKHCACYAQIIRRLQKGMTAEEVVPPFLSVLPEDGDVSNLLGMTAAVMLDSVKRYTARG